MKSSSSESVERERRESVCVCLRERESGRMLRAEGETSNKPTSALKHGGSRQRLHARLVPTRVLNWIIWEIVTTLFFLICIYFSEKFPVAVCGCGTGEEEDEVSLSSRNNGCHWLIIMSADWRWQRNESLSLWHSDDLSVNSSENPRPKLGVYCGKVSERDDLQVSDTEVKFTRSIAVYADTDDDVHNVRTKKCIYLLFWDYWASLLKFYFA